jgi:hypothetical protein
MRIRNVARLVSRVWWIVVGVLLASGSPASAQDRLGGHFGFVIPLVTRADGVTTTIGDDFKIGFPMGVTVKKTDKVAFDLELVPVIQNEPLAISLTVHPGVIFALEHSLAAGLRMAFDVNAASWGFTPLLGKSFPLKGGCAFFAEVDVPIRFQEAADGHSFTAVTLAAHFGLGF